MSRGPLIARRLAIPKIAISPFMLDALITGITSAIVLVSGFLVIGFLAAGLGPTDFGAYILSRRVIAVLAPVVAMSAGVGLPRYLGLHRDFHQRQQGFILASSLIVGILTLITAIVLLGWDETFAVLLFDDPTYKTLVQAIVLFLVGLNVYTLVYATHRGLLQMRIANLWQIGIIAIGPLLLVGFLSRSAEVSQIVFMLGGLACCAFPYMLWRLAKSLRGGGGQYILSATRELLVYGVPRLPSGFLFAGMMSMGPLVATRLGSLEEAGFLGVGFALLRVFEAPLAVFGLVALPRLAYHFGAGDQDFIRDRVGDLTSLLLHVGLFLTLHLFLWSDVIVRLWLGQSYVAAIPLTRIYILALMPFVTFTLLRSVVDAMTVKAVNTVNIVIASAVGALIAVVLILAGIGISSLAIGTSAAFFTLGTLTLIYVWHRVRFDLGVLLVGRISLANIGLLLLAWAAKAWWINQGGGLVMLGQLIVVGSVCLATYLGLLWWWRACWIDQIRSRFKVVMADAGGSK